MDGREGMTLQGSPSYYLNRAGIGGSAASAPSPNFHHGGGGAAAAHQAAGIHPSLVFKNLPNPNIIPPQPNNVVGVGGGGGGGSVITGQPSFHIENPPPNFHHGRSMAIVPAPSQGGEPVKKKRGRPRKYAPDGANTSLGLSPLSATKRSSAVESSGEKSKRGRPPGSGWKQQLAPLGDWMNSSAGLAFTPHVLHVGIGEDIAAKLLAFAQQRSRALCIMSATGSVSSITLRQPTSAATVTYEGRFEILCLSGSYLVSENGGPHNRIGGISISVCSPDGHMIGGAIGGRLVAANPVQVVACSFIYGGGNNKPKSISGSKDEKLLMLEHSSDKSLTPATTKAASTQSYNPNPGTSAWPPISRPEVRNSGINIDLMRG
ncbi:hypothetical protein ABFS83_01G072200 [Erythranthe nasuta]